MPRHKERHRSHRVGWLRAAVLGANDGLISTASLILGVAAAGQDTHAVATAGVAALLAGAASMAAGEYVSVSSQADTERADLDRERRELATDYAAESKELASIYVGRGLPAALAAQVAEALMAHDALGAHARDELGITEALAAQPVQAALTSAATFAVGGVAPLLLALVVPPEYRMVAVAAASIGLLAVLGSIAARAGGASIGTGSFRVVLWGTSAMGLTTAAGMWLGASG